MRDKWIEGEIVNANFLDGRNSANHNRNCRFRYIAPFLICVLAGGLLILTRIPFVHARGSDSLSILVQTTLSGGVFLFFFGSAILWVHIAFQSMLARFAFLAFGALLALAPSIGIVVDSKHLPSTIEIKLGFINLKSIKAKSSESAIECQLEDNHFVFRQEETVLMRFPQGIWPLKFARHT